MTRTVAIIGASADRSKFGNKAVRAYTQLGWHVRPVNPKESTIEGLPAFSAFASIPDAHLDRVSIYLPPAVVLVILPDLQTKSISEVWFNPGCDTPEVLARARALGLNVIAGCSIVDLGVSPAEFP